MKQRSTIFTLAMILMLLASMVFQVAPASALSGSYFTTTDNENNAYTGVADGDMDLYMYNNDGVHPIEFNIAIPVGGLPTNEGILAIYAFDVDEEQGELDLVKLNGTTLGYFSGTNNLWSTSAFVIPAGVLVEGNNLVEVFVDSGNTGWASQVDWGQIIVDGGVGTPGRINSVIINSSSVASGTVTLNVDVTVEALADGNFRLETNLVSPTGTSPSANTQSFSMTAGQIVSYPVTLTYPANTATGQFVIRGNLFDNSTGVLNSTKITAFNHVVNVGPDASPTITGILPNHGPVAGGQTIVISGTNFTGASSFTFGGVAATCTVDSATQITCTTPAHAYGPVDVSVTTPSGTATASGGYWYYNLPTITSITPTSGPAAGGTDITINGTNLDTITQVSFGGVDAACHTIVSPNQIICTTGAHAAGLVDLVVTTYGGTATLPNAYTYLSGPSISNINPNTGPVSGGTSVVITGTNFLGTSSVTFGGTAANLAACTVTDTLITCSSPAHAAGPVDVVITTPGGTATSTGGFTYIAFPTVTSITRVNPSPTNLGSVAYMVTFSDAVTGVNLTAPFSDFALTTTSVTGASISAVSGSGTTYTVTVNTGTGNGTIRLDVVDDDTVITAGLIPLGGAGAGNGNFITGEIYTINKNVEVYIHGDLKGTYSLAAIDSTRPSYAGIDSAPLKVTSTNANAPVIAAIRSLWASNGVNTSYSQLMGLPQAQLSNKYVFPGYNNVTLNEQLRISNVDSVPSTVTVTIAGTVRGTYTLQPNDSVRVNYPGVDSGPVVVEGTPNVNIISSIRMAWAVNGVTKSFTQLMGLPAVQLSSKYVFPAYNNVTLNEQLRIGNVDTLPSTVTVTIGGVIRGTYTLQPSQAIRVNYAGLDTGPVVVVGTPNVKIISSIRSAWAVNGVTTSFTQFMGTPQEQLSNKYLYPVYDNVTLNEQLRIANVDSAPSTVTVTIGGVQRGIYILQPSQAVRINYPGLDTGLVVVEGTTGVNITSSLRSAWAVNGATQSFVQLMGLPAEHLSTTYWFPAYNNVSLSEQLRFAAP